MQDIKKKLDDQLKDFNSTVIKAVAIDVDGTLINEQKICTPRTEKAIKNLIESGRHVFIVTGRSVGKTLPFADQVAIPQYTINHNGAVIWNIKTKEKELDLCIHDEIVKGMIDLIREKDLFTVLEIDDAVYAEKYYEQLTNFNLLDKSTVHKFLISISNEETQALTALLKSKFGEEIHIIQTRSNISNPDGNRYCLEIMHKGVNKGKTLKNVLAMFDIRLDEAVAFGDDLNDLEMLTSVRYGVAMGNGRTAILEAAPYTTLTNKDEGVAYFIEKYILHQ
ncbi:MAG: Cof-type HAD-IIB family hydrolase [Brevinema sp.]